MGAIIRGKDLGTRFRAAWLSSALLPVPPDERCAGAFEPDDPGAPLMMGFVFMERWCSEVL